MQRTCNWYERIIKELELPKNTTFVEVGEIIEIYGKRELVRDGLIPDADSPADASQVSGAFSRFLKARRNNLGVQKATAG